MAKINNLEALRNTILQGDAFEKLKEIPDESIDCVITSPPYWLLRNYLPADHPHKSKEIGNEPTLTEYLDKLLLIFAEIKRVLKKTGVFFLNWNDSYYNNSKFSKLNKPLLIEKSLCLQNYRGLMMMLDDLRKWELKSDISEKDKKFLLGELHRIQNFRLRLFKEEIPPDLLHFFKPVDPHPQSGQFILRNQIIWVKSNYLPNSAKDRFINAYEPVFMLVKDKKYYFNNEALGIPYKIETLKRFLRNYYSLEKTPVETQKNLLRWIHKIKKNLGITNKEAIKKIFNNNQETQSLFISTISNDINNLLDVNFLKAKPCDVLIIPTEFSLSTKEKCPARFPTQLVHYLVLAGCPPYTCQKCGYPITNNQKQCQCGETKFVKGIVLDPFAGSGTTLIVAKMLNRDYIGIELSDTYCENIHQQLKKTPIQFNLIETK